MTEFYDDFEDDFNEVEEEIVQKVATAKKVKKEKFSFDILFAVFGVCLAGSAAFLPWYVFLNQEEFSVKKMAYGKDRVLPNWEGRTVVNTSPSAIVRRDPNAPDFAPSPDSITTASIPSDAGDGSGGSQAFPGPRYKLLHVVNGRALIEDMSGMYMVKVGSTLPDNSILSSLEERGNGWAIVTSNGDVIQN